MNALRHIRKSVLNVSQSEMARIAGVSQGTVSKWERDGSKPRMEEMSRIRAEAHQRGLDWQDSWFFERATQ